LLPHDAPGLAVVVFHQVGRQVRIPVRVHRPEPTSRSAGTAILAGGTAGGTTGAGRDRRRRGDVRTVRAAVDSVLAINASTATANAYNETANGVSRALAFHA
ncbi:hypothetical protein, partial [Actinoplanes sp. NPDC049118]|uniref:hypothetical protein n=1 Tax=Actinoplanes sp. NPDC049118 TaxID=3155769 RepID=UPI0033FBC50F